MGEHDPAEQRPHGAGTPWWVVVGIALLSAALGATATLVIVGGTDVAAPTTTVAAAPDTTTTTITVPAAPSTTAPTTTVPVTEAPPPEDPPDADGGHDDDFAEPQPLATFDVVGDELVADDVPAGLHERAGAIWGRFVELIPADLRDTVTGFELMDVEYDGAHVYPTDEDPTAWVLGVSERLGRDLDVTLLHEWGHLVTLAASEVPPNPNADGCKTYFTGEGCALPDSTFARFVAEFWPPEMVAEAEEIYDIADDEEYFDAVDDFLARYPDTFVTEYAATNPGEDLAETIAVFIVEDPPEGDTVADRKILFFWDDPWFLDARERIRVNL